MSELLPGEFAIRCFDNPPDSPSYVSWADVGPNQPFLNTAPDTVSDTEKFYFTAYTPEYTRIQALNKQYVTVPPGGGLILTDEPEEGSSFALIGPQLIENHWGGPGGPVCFGFNIRTSNGFFLSAVDRGGQSSNAFLTDVTVAQDWEMFNIVQAGVQTLEGGVQAGELGSGYRYTFNPVAPPNSLPIGGLEGITLIKADPPPGTIETEPPAQGYVFLLSNGFNYLTAVGGGGVTGPLGDVFHFDAWNPLSWEVFNIIPNTFLSSVYPSYFIQTAVSGLYVGYDASLGLWTTALEDPQQFQSGPFNPVFEFQMVRTPVHGDFLVE